MLIEGGKTRTGVGSISSNDFDDFTDDDWSCLSCACWMCRYIKVWEWWKRNNSFKSIHIHTILFVRMTARWRRTTTTRCIWRCHWCILIPRNLFCKRYYLYKICLELQKLRIVCIHWKQLVDLGQLLLVLANLTGNIRHDLVWVLVFRFRSFAPLN